MTATRLAAALLSRKLSCTTLQSIRAYLIVASVATIVLDAVVRVLIGLFNVPESAFERRNFRIAILISVSIATLGAKASRSFPTGQHCDSVTLRPL